jgi:hypothetical protein
MWRVWETFQREQFGGKVPATPVVSGVLAETASMISATENSISLPRGGTGAAATPPSPQDTSAGRISVATRPGASCDAATAAAASAPTLVVLSELRTQPFSDPAIALMSDSSGASYFLWYVA